MAFMASGALHAADDKAFSDLQADVARKNAEIERLTRELAKSRGTAVVAPVAVQPVASPSAGPVTAETTAKPQALEAVVVRSRRQLEKLHDVPVSISVISGGELEREQASDFEALTKRLGNITFNQNNTRGSSLSIRGLGRRGFTETQDPSVGVIVDGVSYGLTQLGNFDFYDIGSVEVARGPQGTLLGKGASAGAVTVNSKAPSFTPSADYEVTYGQRETVILKGAFGGPIIEDLLAWRGSFVVDKQRGFYANDYNERNLDTMYPRDRVSARTQFLLTPSSDLNAKFSFDYQPRQSQLQNGLTEFVRQPLRYDNGTLTDPNGTSAVSKLEGYTTAAGASVPGRQWFAGRGFGTGQYLNSITTTGTTHQNEIQGQTTSTGGASAEVNWIRDDYTLTSISAYRKYTFYARNDEGTPFDISKNGGGSVFYNQASQEFRISAKPSKLIDYQAGLYFMRTQDDVESRSGYGSDAGAWFATTAQYNTLFGNAGTNIGSGSALLRDSLTDLYKWGDTHIETYSKAIFGQANLHPTEQLTVTAGLRVTNENRSTTAFGALFNQGNGSALNPISARTDGGTATVNLGGFDSDASGNLKAGNSADQLAKADSVAARYYGVASYNSLTAAQKAQVAAAKAIRSAQIGTLINNVRGEYKGNLGTALLSPSFKFNENLTGYASWQYGEKSGSAIIVNGVASTVKPEKTNAYELGVKTFLLDKKLTLNADVYFMDIKDYQQTVVAVDDFATQTNIANGLANPLVYTSVQGNVPKVQVQGVEVDAAYSGIPYTNVRFAGSYNDARYKSFPNAGKPSELGYLASPFIDQSGKLVGGAPYWSVNIGAEYRRPVLSDRIFHASFTTAYISKSQTDELLSDYSTVPDHSTTDLAIGLGAHNNAFDVSVVVKNAFDDRAHETGWSSYSPYPYPRWVGLVFSGKL